MAVLIVAILPYESGWHPSGRSISAALLFFLRPLSSSSSYPEGGTEYLLRPQVPLVLLILSVSVGEILLSKKKVGFESLLPWHLAAHRFCASMTLHSFFVDITYLFIVITCLRSPKLSTVTAWSRVVQACSLSSCPSSS